MRTIVITGVLLGVLLACVFLALKTGGPSAGTGRSSQPTTSTGSSSAVPAGSNSLRLPADTSRLIAGTQSPIFILSDFEQSPGAWEADHRLPACRHATVARVRDRAQQGAFWLKMDGVRMDSQSHDAAFSIKPDTKDLSGRGTVLSAAVFLPKEAMAGLNVRLGIEDTHGGRHEQQDAAQLTPGQWTLVSWTAGDFLADTGRLLVMVRSGDQGYSGYLGLDNVTVHSDTTPAITDLRASITKEGCLRLGGNGGFLARVGVGAFGPDWQYACQNTNATVKALADSMEATGTLNAPGSPAAPIKYRITAKPTYNREIEVSVEATPQAAAKVRSLGIEVLVPRNVFGSTTIDAAPAGPAANPNLPLLFAATTADLHMAGDSPFGMEIRAQSPAVVTVLDDLVPVTFTYTAQKALQSANLAGVFNGWNTTATPMKGSADGKTWQATVPMPPGEQQYKFVLNGSEWVTDPHSTKDIKDRDGNTNSVKFVPRLSDEARPAAFHVMVNLVGSADGAPVSLTPNQTLRRTFRLVLNQPFKNQMSKIEP